MSPLAFSLRLLQSQPDERLLALARSGHEPAFEALVRRYRKPLLAYSRRTAPEAPAEDVLQQALLQAWRALDSGAEVRDARAWLYRIVHNVAISTARRAPERPAALAETVSAAEVEHVVEQRLAARDALAQIAALPDLQRQVMLETALEGRSHEEVGTSLGLTGGSVRGLVYRARAALRAAAAALIPAPVIDWAARRGPLPRAGTYEALAGGGSAGAAGAVIKGGAIVTVAGAIAGGAVVATHHFEHRPPARIARLGAGSHHGLALPGSEGAADVLVPPGGPRGRDPSGGRCGHDLAGRRS
jgi:RNA polymerase sigma factor (sigma-70 family)